MASVIIKRRFLLIIIITVNYCIRWRNLFSSLRRLMDEVMSPMTILVELSCMLAPGAGGGGGIAAPSVLECGGELLFCLAPVLSGDMTELELQVWHCWTYSRVLWYASGCISTLLFPAPPGGLLVSDAFW